MGLGTGIFVLCCGLFSALACAGEKRTFYIPAESAELSVRTFVEQAGLSVVYEAGRLAPFQTRALQGEYDPIDALKQLLDGSGLTYTMLNPRVVAVDPIPTPPETSAPGTTPPVVHEIATVRIQKVRYLEDDLSLGAGSHIQVISDIELQREGFSTLDEWVRALPQNQGSGATEDTFAFQREARTNTAIGSGINLYGIGQRATLILVNGRRLAPSGSAGTFTDVSNLPISAVDHIEIVSGGTTTKYGADAAGGIVNIVLHDPSSGSVTSAASSLQPNNPLGEKVFSQSLAHQWDRFAGLLSFEYYSREQLPASARSQGTSDLQPRGGNFDSLDSNPANIMDSLGRLWGVPPGQNGTALTPAQLLTTLNRSDQIAGTWLLPHQERLNFLANATYRIADDWTLSFNSLLNRRTLEDLQAPLGAVLSVPSTNPFYVNPVSGSQAPVTVLYNFGKDLGPITESGRVTSGQFALGLDHPLGDNWKLSSSLGYAFEDQHLTQQNLVNFGILQQYLASSDASTAFNPFGDGSNTTAATLNAIRADGWLKYDSAFTTVDLSAAGKIPLSLAGPMSLTAGYQYRVQTFESTVNPSLSSANLISSPPTNKDRTLSALYLQSSLPVLTPDSITHLPVKLDVSGGVRYEHYSDAGSVATPSAGFVFEPVTDWRVKGSWARFFRPPNLPDLNEAPNVSEVFPLADPKSPTGYTAALVWTGNNSSLRAETARSWNVGTDWAPLTGLAMELNYYRIVAPNQVMAAQPLSRTELSDPLYAYAVTRNQSAAQQAQVCSHSQFVGTPAECLSSSIGALIDLRIRNAATLQTDGFDFNTKYTRDTQRGTVGININATYVLHFDVAQLPGEALVPYRNTPHYPMALRLRSVFSWDWRGFFLTPAVNFQSSYVDNISVPSRPVDSWTTWDMVLGYQLPLAHPGGKGQLSVALRGFNIFNQQPPFLNNSLSTIGYDPENGDLLGRRVSLAVQYKW